MLIMRADTQCRYDPRTFRARTFHDVTGRFRDGADSPRDYLERCLDAIATRDDVVQAFVTLNPAGARAAADASTARWTAGAPLSPIDGMPIGIKDLLETKDMPTQMGCEGLRGNFPKRDNAAVRALRDAGAVIVGKTVTAELGGAHPGPTTNPFDPARTPGGSSSGSAAAVAAGMLPAAIGTQVGGSIIRPAAYCGNVALKPTQGAINRGERQTTSMSTHGVHAGCIEDVWLTAIAIASRAGGDPGAPGLLGPDATPQASRPRALVVLETEGWPDLDGGTRAAFETLLEALAASGIALLRRRDHPAVEALERAVVDARAVANAITGWENRWTIRNLVDQSPDGVSARGKASLARAEAMTLEHYRTHLATRGMAQACHAGVGALADAVITLSCAGPAPIWHGDVPGEPLAPRPTGDIAFNAPSSLLFAPAVTMPLLAVAGMPVGVQLMGRPHEDARIVGLARWMLEAVTPIAMP
jgi:Asp-tRNA(Asn)/Glu-tRNA(Gln) amidotransferase A subunit family amidase